MVYIPPIKPLPPNADDETRRRAYWEYVDLCVATNPAWFLPVGVKKRWWHLLKVEHPETSRSRLDLGYPITPASPFEQILLGTIALHELYRQGKDEGSEADTIRDSLDGPWRSISSSERTTALAVSAALQRFQQ